MDLAVLLQSKGDDSPSGENLEYDPAFTAMQLAAQPGEERQIGDEITAAADPDYGEVLRTAQAILERSHDLRAAVFLADAILQSDGLQGFADVTRYIRACLEDFWDSCHPQLDEDDGDPTMRINAVQELCGKPGEMAGPSPAYRSLRRTPLTDSRSFGRLTLREIEIAEGLTRAPADMEGVPDTATVNAAFKDTDAAVLGALLGAARDASENVLAISAVFDERTPGQGPDLGPLVKLLHQIARRLGEHVRGEDAQGGEAAAEDAAQPAADDGAAAPPPAVAGAIRSPTDVANALDRIMAYYKSHEPSSPIPLLLERAKRLVNADFLTIMQDMAPQGIDNVHLIGGIEDEN
ncbi:MAG: type VI secretion system protein TssA [Rhodobacteraceae bacterium]|nr:type VI secretion system protein TssA [Paracoccaceae bacterium]